MTFDYDQIQSGHYDEVFHRHQGIQSCWHHLKFQQVKDALGACARHLDIGCGPGTLIGLLDATGKLGIVVHVGSIDSVEGSEWAFNRTPGVDPGPPIIPEPASVFIWGLLVTIVVATGYRRRRMS